MVCLLPSKLLNFNMTLSIVSFPSLIPLYQLSLQHVLGKRGIQYANKILSERHISKKIPYSTNYLPSMKPVVYYRFWTVETRKCFCSVLIQLLFTNMQINASSQVNMAYFLCLLHIGEPSQHCICS